MYHLLLLILLITNVEIKAENYNTYSALSLRDFYYMNADIGYDIEYVRDRNYTINITFDIACIHVIKGTFLDNKDCYFTNPACILTEVRDISVADTYFGLHTVAVKACLGVLPTTRRTPLHVTEFKLLYYTVKTSLDFKLTARPYDNILQFDTGEIMLSPMSPHGTISFKVSPDDHTINIEYNYLSILSSWYDKRVTNDLVNYGATVWSDRTRVRIKLKKDYGKVDYNKIFPFSIRDVALNVSYTRKRSPTKCKHTQFYKCADYYIDYSLNINSRDFKSTTYVHATTISISSRILWVVQQLGYYFLEGIEAIFSFILKLLSKSFYYSIDTLITERNADYCVIEYVTILSFLYIYSPKFIKSILITIIVAVILGYRREKSIMGDISKFIGFEEMCMHLISEMENIE